MVNSHSDYIVLSAEIDKNVRQPTPPESPEPAQSSSSSDADDDQGGARVQQKNSAKGSSHKNPLEAIQHFLSTKLHISLFESDDESDAAEEKLLKSLDFKGLVEHWKDKGFKKIITAVGAGISTCEYANKIIVSLEESFMSITVFYLN